MTNFYQRSISILKKKNLYRTPKTNYYNNLSKKITSFCSNDYLGLSQNKDIINASIIATKNHGFGSTASRYIYSNHDLTEKLEKKLSKIKNTQNSLIFGSGYLAGISTIKALVGKGDLIIADKLIHSCLIDGALLSGAKLLRFKHNDLNQAKQIIDKFRTKYKKCLMISETVFSMDGDLGKIEELLEIALKYDSLLISDDAHGFGIIKKCYKKEYNDNHIQMGTLSKAVAGYGGYVCASNIIIDYLKNFAKSAIYSTALPPAILAGNLKSLEIIENDNSRFKQALDNTNYFCKLIGMKKNYSTIVVIIIKEEKKTIQIAHEAERSGFLISAIRPPTVEINKSRLRITFKANHKRSEIEALADFIIKMNIV